MSFQFAIREFHNWSVKDQRDQINLMAENQAKIALQAILEGMAITEAIAIGYTYPPDES